MTRDLEHSGRDGATPKDNRAKRVAPESAPGSSALLATAGAAEPPRRSCTAACSGARFETPLSGRTNGRARSMHVRRSHRTPGHRPKRRSKRSSSMDDWITSSNRAPTRRRWDEGSGRRLRLSERRLVVPSSAGSRMGARWRLSPREASSITERKLFDRVSEGTTSACNRRQGRACLVLYLVLGVFPADGSGKVANLPEEDEQCRGVGPHVVGGGRLSASRARRAASVTRDQRKRLVQPMSAARSDER